MHLSSLPLYTFTIPTELKYIYGSADIRKHLELKRNSSDLRRKACVCVANVHRINSTLENLKRSYPGNTVNGS